MKKKIGKNSGDSGQGESNPPKKIKGLLAWTPENREKTSAARMGRDRGS